MNFYMCRYRHNQHSDQDTEPLQQPRKFSHPLSQTSLSKGHSYSDFHHPRLALPVFGLHMRGHIQCVLFYVWVLSPTVRLSCVAVCINNLSFFTAAWYSAV